MALEKKWLFINGAERIVVCDPENDSLADVLRRIGLTGTKIGCGTGQCGACSVILDGKVIRSCVRKMKLVAEFAKITTIEGVGSPTNLHPIQLAWITYGGVQCGFCTPGFIISAYQLLQDNPDPTRDEVREWFQKHKNICRCTGYKQLVDAVMAAAEVINGKKSLDDITFKMPKDSRIYGTRQPKPTALAKVTGLCDFGDDVGLKMPYGTLHLAIVQPDVCHALIKEIDLKEAECMPGVVKVITAKDIPGGNRIKQGFTHARSKVDRFIRPILADEKIFRYGDVVAIVAAETREQARNAAKEVKIKYEELPTYMTLLDSLNPEAIQIHEGIPNQFCVQPLYKGNDTKEIFDKAPYVVEGSFYSSRQPHLPIEPDTMQAYYDGKGRLTIQCKSQHIYGTRNVIAASFGLEPENVRIIENPTGASFGSAMTPSAPALVAAAAIVLNKPVTLTMSYAESTFFSGKRAPAYSNARLACDKDGKIIALEFDHAYDIGAYTEWCQTKISKSVRFIGYPYNIPNIKGLGRLVFSNASWCVTFRAFGSPQCFTVSEALMDMMADKIGIDRLEFRYKNVAQPGDTNNTGALYKGYPMRQLLDMLRPHYEVAKKRCSEFCVPGKKRGVGIVCGGYHVGMSGDSAQVLLELNYDNTVTCYNSWEDQGQGADGGTLVLVHEALRPLRLSPESIKIVQNDTGQTPPSGPAAASRSHYMIGNATIDAAKKLLKAMEKQDGSYRTYDEMIAENIPTKYEGRYAVPTITQDPNTGEGDLSTEDMFVSHLAEVEVDINTGEVKVVSMKSACDVGVIGNMLGLEGQAYGGVSHCIGYALTEDYSDFKKHSSMAGAGIPSILDIPDDFDFMYLETPRNNGPYGSGGASESFQSTAHMAVINAINDAIGVRIYDLPAKPEKIRKALEQKAQNKKIQPVKYSFGIPFEDMLALIKADPK